jgi:hypothetical protein
MGISDGSIIATIMTSHMPRKDAPAAVQVCPCMRIQAIDMVHPPGIRMPAIADIDPHPTTVTAAATAKSSAAAPRNADSEAVAGAELFRAAQ